MVMHEPLWIGRSCTHDAGADRRRDRSGRPAAEILTRERLEHAYGCRLNELHQAEGRSFVPDI